MSADQRSATVVAGARPRPVLADREVLHLFCCNCGREASASSAGVDIQRLLPGPDRGRTCLTLRRCRSKRPICRPRAVHPGGRAADRGVGESVLARRVAIGADRRLIVVDQHEDLTGNRNGVTSTPPEASCPVQAGGTSLVSTSLDFDDLGTSEAPCFCIERREPIAHRLNGWFSPRLFGRVVRLVWSFGAGAGVRWKESRSWL